MGHKSKLNKQKPIQQQTQPKQNDQPASPLKIEDVKSSATEAEFNSKKEKLFEQLETEYASHVEEIKKLKAEINGYNERKSKLKSELDEQRNKNAEEFREFQNKKDEASKNLGEAIKGQKEAEERAKEIYESAEKEKSEIIKKANEDARNAIKKHNDDLKIQSDKLLEREKNLGFEQIKLDKEKLDLELQKEELTEMQNFVKLQKERYSEASPVKVEELTLELSDKCVKYENLSSKYNEQTKKYNDLQILIDSIKTEIGDSTEGKKSATVKGLYLELKELKAEYDSLVSLHKRYPDDESVRPLEKKAEQFQTLEKKLEALERERDRFHEEASAVRRSQKELEAIKQEVEATNALNEHLLKELDKHKTALESRTGDTCPDLTKVDDETESDDFINKIKEKTGREQLKSLSEIVSHVKNYAGKCELLFYSDDDIRAFLAGMAASRLIILEGMSGTGKSSLPRIFAKATSGFNRLIPVESSWRDRNELIGYYNDFNKKFNAKSFTIELYRSGNERCIDIPTFIVLDEMNLARVEYYFSDFLAVLEEPDKEKWKIELVASDMRTLPLELPEKVKEKMRKESESVYSIWEKIEKSRKGELSHETSDDEKTKLFEYLKNLSGLTGAKNLIDGRKIKITENIWFVGTANRDESTFEISDKVYDRAQIISLNKRGVPESYNSSVKRMYISAKRLTGLFEEAINKTKIKDEIEPKLEELDTLLGDKFNVSFGNRIVTKAIEFAAVFEAAGGKLDIALDYQISTKILRKVIMTDDSKALLELQGKTTAYPKTQKLIENRIKVLSER
ncbi:MAG: hypothetical protein LBH05_02200 [Deferribacteraceae bacterium]|jgi:hypothetical protein|nr:hypothetical protein [Deferribacteraceae bacterium]